MRSLLNMTKTAKKIGGGRNGLLSVAPNHGGNASVAFYTSGLKAAPSMCKIFRPKITKSVQNRLKNVNKISKQIFRLV